MLSFMVIKKHHRWMFALLGGLYLQACASAQAGPRPDGLEPGGLVIFQDRIEQMRVRTALEVVERGAPHLTIQRTRQGNPVQITYRGRDSIMLMGDVQVVIDGAMVGDGVRALENIPAKTVRYIQILSGREAVIRYGSGGGNGVIVVKTTAG